MIKWGAVVDANDRDALIDYLSTNFSPDEPPYQAPRISSHEPVQNAAQGRRRSRSDRKKQSATDPVSCKAFWTLRQRCQFRAQTDEVSIGISMHY
jgi:hypothetical protein